MEAVARTKPRLRLLVAGKLNRHRRAIDGLTIDGMGDLRARMANAAMVCAIDNLMALAHLYAAIARRLDERCGSPYALTEAEWAAILNSYSRRAS